MGELPIQLRRFTQRSQLDIALAVQLKEALAPSGAQRGEAQERRSAAIMLSGGRTPLPAYQLIASQETRPSLDTHVFYSDERYVPVYSPDNNYRATLPLLQSLSLPEEQVLRVRTELSLQQAATDYERHLQKWIEAGMRFKLGLLGLGADGHTASLFNAADLDRAQGHLAIPVQRPDGLQAISVTPDLLAHMEMLLFVVAGADKCAALTALLAQDSNLVAWQAIKRCRHIEVWCENVA